MERNADGLSLPNQNTIIINIIWGYFIHVERSKVGPKKRNPDGLTITRASHPSMKGRYSPKQWMIYL